jgi:hypothetical protein
MAEVEISLLEQAHRLVGELRQVANIKFGQYWNTSTRTTQNANIITSIMRTVWYINEDRNTTIAYLDILIKNTFDIMENIYDELTHENISPDSVYKFTNVLRDLKVEILNCQMGITNLQGVYKDDESMKGDLLRCIVKIKEHYEALQLEYFDLDYLPYCNPYPINVPHNDLSTSTISQTPYNTPDCIPDDLCTKRN